MSWIDKLFSKWAVDKSDIIKKILSKSNIKHSVSEKQKTKRNIPTIDCSDEVSKIKHSLLSDCDKNFNYEELNEFENKEQIIEFILNNWSLVNLDRILMKKLYGEQYYKIPNSEEIQEKLDYICLREKSRIMHLIHKEKYLKDNFIWCKLNTLDVKDELNGALCLLEDVDKLPWMRQRSNGKWFIRFNFIPTYNTDNSKRKVKFYHNGEFHKMYNKDFELYCEENNLIYPTLRNFLEYAHTQELKKKSKR